MRYNPQPSASYYKPSISPWKWVPAGIFGGITGGFGTAWLLWGAPSLLTRMFCFLFKVPIVLLMLVLVATMGCSFIIVGRTLVLGIRRLVRPQPLMSYEPQEPIPELQLIQRPHPGCGLVFLVPILLIAGAGSVPWLWIAPQQVPLGRLLLSAAVGVPVGLAIAWQEVKREMVNQGFSG